METEKFKTVFNADALEKVEVYQPAVVWRISYKKEIKSWLSNRKDGFYTDYSEKFLGNEYDLLGGSYNKTRIIVKDNVAYWRPYVELKFIGGSTKISTFDTIEECNAYATEISEKYIINKI